MYLYIKHLQKSTLKIGYLQAKIPTFAKGKIER